MLHISSQQGDKQRRRQASRGNQISRETAPKKNQPRSGKSVLGGRGTLYAPTEGKPRWQCAIHDPVTLKRRIFSAKTQDDIVTKTQTALGN